MDMFDSPSSAVETIDLRQFTIRTSDNCGLGEEDPPSKMPLSLPLILSRSAFKWPSLAIWACDTVSSYALTKTM